jgi:Leucine-rich repeat (LRR) protein
VEELPSSIGKLSGLHRLVVHGCAKLTRLGDKIGGLVGLRVLDMSDVNVQELPSSIGNLTRCVRLTLSLHCLGGLTSGIGGMVGLRELDLGWSTVNELPSSIGQLPRLEKLDLQHCLQLERLPEEIGNMTGLRISLRGLGFRVYPITNYPYPRASAQTQQHFVRLQRASRCFNELHELHTLLM